jgi:hypothetical protein
VALGTPAIGTPNQLELRAVQTAVSNIRQRIEALETVTTGTVTQANTTTNASAAGIAQLRAMLAALSARVDALAPSADVLTADDAQSMLAVRGFMPHVPLTQNRPVDDAAGVLATRVFIPRAVSSLPVPDDEPEILAARVFMPHVLPGISPTADDSAAMLAARAFMPHVGLTQPVVVPTVPTADDSAAMLAARAFMPHVLPGILPTADDATNILAVSIFGA